jgi:hypothetical protein
VGILDKNRFEKNLCHRHSHFQLAPSFFCRFLFGMVFCLLYSGYGKKISSVKKSVIMKKLLITSLAAVGAALLIGG